MSLLSLRRGLNGYISRRNQGAAVAGGSFQAGRTIVKRSGSIFKKAVKRVKKDKKFTPSAQYERKPAQYQSKVRIARKRADFKKKRQVRVTRRERTKIQTVTKGYFPTGYYHEIHTQKMGLNANQQNVQEVPETSLSDGLKGQLFDPTRILDAASILWNNKTPSVNKTVIAAGNFNNKNTMIDIKNCYAVIKLKNQSQRLLNVCVYTLDPKSSQDTSVSPLNAWINELTNMSTLAPIVTGSNVLDNSVNTLYNTPKLLKGMNQQYKISKDYYEMFPGQEVTFNVQGPMNTRLDMQKCWRGLNYQNLDKKFSRNVIMTVHGDMTTDSFAPNNVSRGPMPVGPTGLITEVNLKYILHQPDQCGWYNPTGGIGATAGVVPLEMRRYAFAINNLSTSVAEATQKQVLENSPDVVLTNPT